MTAPARGPRFSGRERQALELRASGLPIRDIAAVMVVSESTVKTYLHRVYRKLGAQGDPIGAFNIAYETGVLPCPCGGRRA